MIRKIAVSLSIVAVIIALLIWKVQASILYSHPLSSKYKLTVRTVGDGNVDKTTLEITYHYPPAIGMYAVAHQIVDRPSSRITFSHIADRETKLQCVYDNNGAGFLLMYHEPSDDLWDSTGRSGGWNGTDDALWQQRLEQLLQRHASIPYSVLPRQN